MKLNYTTSIITLLLSIFLFYSCETEKKPEFKPKEKLKRTKLVALTGYNAYSYFIYKGQPMGFDYERVNRLADNLKLELELKVVNSISDMFHQVNSGEGDIIAFNLTITKDRLQEVQFTNSYNNIKHKINIKYRDYTVTLSNFLFKYVVMGLSRY